MPARRMHWAMLLCAAMTGCASSGEPKGEDLARQRAAEANKPGPAADYVLAPGDLLTVKFFYNPELTEQLPIRPDGKVSLQLVGDVEATGLTVAELRGHLVDRYTGIVKHPELAVIVNSFGAQKVYVGGEVNHPGEIALVPGMTTLQAIILAGGYRTTSGMSNVVIVRDQGSENPLFLLVDLKHGLSHLDDSRDVRLQPRDIIVVPMTTIAKIDLFVRQYITELLPVALGFNVNYDFNNVRATGQ